MLRARSTRSTRGLAASAVAALAVSGLALAPRADAAPAGGVVLVSLFNQGATAIEADYQDEAGGWTFDSVRLSAVRLDPDAAVSFEYNLDPEATNGDPGWTAVAGPDASQGDDLVGVLWRPYDDELGDLDGSAVSIRAVATTSAGATYSLRNGVDVEYRSKEEGSVQIDPYTSSYFLQPYASSGRTRTLARVTGTTGEPDGTVELSWWRAGDRTFRGQTDAAVTPDYGNKFTTGQFDQVLDLAGAGADGTRSVLVGAEIDGDDVRAVGPQHITNVYASGAQVREGETAMVDVLVTDQFNRPIDGAEVGSAERGTVLGYTVDGRLRVPQPVGTDAYYANTTDVDAYEDGNDPVSGPVEVTSYVPERSSRTSYLLDDGDLFDRDEYEPGDIGVEVLDQNNQTYTAEPVTVLYKLWRDGSPEPTDYSEIVSGPDGRAAIPVDTEADAGTFQVAYRLPEWADGSDPDTPREDDVRFSFTMGDAVLTVSPKAGAVASEPGGRVDYTGRLLMFGRPFTGRMIGVDFARGLELVPGRTADAGVVAPGGLATSVRLPVQSNGSFRFSVQDPAETPRASESGGRVTIRTVDPIPADQVGARDGNAGERKVSRVDFGTTRGRAVVTVSGTSKRAADVLRVAGPDSVGGETVRVYRVVGRSRQLVATRRLDARGDVAAVSVPDRNGTALTTYVVDLVASKRVLGSSSAPVRVR